MNRFKILLFAGTTEGRELVAFLKELCVTLTIYVATSYGAELLETTQEKVIFKRLNEAEMKGLLKQEQYDVVVDATHPFATLVTDYIKKACVQTHIPYIRIIRRDQIVKNGVRVNTIEAAAAYLKHTEGNILVTTGSKVLEPFTELSHYEERIYIRLLPIGEQIERCRVLGFLSSHLIAMQGPFSKEMNEALLSYTQAKYLVTKESGKSGGVKEKLEACEKRGVEAIIINKPREEKGFLLEEAKAYLDLLITRNKAIKGGVKNEGSTYFSPWES